MQRVRDFRVLGLKRGVFIKLLPSRLKGLCRRGGKKNSGNNQMSWMTPRKQHHSDTTGLIHTCTHRDCDSMHKKAQVQIRQNFSTDERDTKSHF